jgi:prepilin-type N-terminal cleavage/methylation domain-containing protein
MPRTWGSFLHSSPERRAAGRGTPGFTLLELLVVLVLVALVAGMVAPVASRGLEAARERAAVADLRALLEGLPVRAFRQGVPQSYDAQALERLLVELPAGWSLRLAAPLQYSASGAAAGGSVTLLAPARSVQELRVLAVSGEVVTPDRRP